MSSDLVRLPDGVPVKSVELCIYFSPDGSVDLPVLVDLILANLNSLQIRGVEGKFRHPFAKEYAA